jgi:hypothetical protein
MEEHRLRVLGNMVLRGYSNLNGMMLQKVRENCSKKLHSMFCSPETRMVIVRLATWARYMRYKKCTENCGQKTEWIILE